jgi:multiple antibiotic resistance protein
MPLSDEFLRFAAALFAIMNPFGNIAIFLSITADRSAAERGRIATMTAGAVLITLLVAAVLGQQILALFDISVGSFRIAGGIIILILALSMLHAQQSGVHHSALEEDAGKAKDNPAVFPLAIPMIAGPGSMATVILYAQHAQGLADAATIGAVIVLMCALLLAALHAADRMSAFLGTTGLNVLTRLMGMILAAIAIEMMVGGLTELFPQLHPGG